MAALEGEAEFWRQRYMELLQNHNAIVALMAKRDEKLEQAAKLGKIGQALQQRKAQQTDSETDGPANPEPHAGQDAPVTEQDLTEQDLAALRKAGTSAPGSKAAPARRAAQG